jgi:hypothetical protein
MKTYEVIKDRNESSEELKSGFENLKEALEFAKHEIMNTDLENDSEGINIYSENGIEITMCKENENSFSYAKLNPATSMQIEDTVIVKL